MKNSLFAQQLTLDTSLYSQESRRRFFKAYQVQAPTSLISKWT